MLRHNRRAGACSRRSYRAHFKRREQAPALQQRRKMLWISRKYQSVSVWRYLPTLPPVAVPDKIFGLTPYLDFIDRCHSLPSLPLPPAAVGSLPMNRYAHLNEQQKQEILSKAHHVRSEKEMYDLVASLANGTMY